MPGAKPKFWNQWQYALVPREIQNAAVRTTGESARWIVAHGGGLDSRRADSPAVAEVMASIHSGGSFELPKGPFKTIHRRLPSVEDLLFEAAMQIRKVGAHNSCWWHKHEAAVWWCADEIDARASKLSDSGEPLVSDSDQIIALFKMVPGVRHVRVVIDAVPNRRKDGTWIEVYPSCPS